MKIKIQNIKEPELLFPKMTCDIKLNQNLDNYPALNNMNKFSFNIILGKPGSGKTSILYALLKKGGKNKLFKKVFENIFLFMPTNSRNSFNDNIFSSLSEENVHDELTFDNLTEVWGRIRDDSREGYKSLIILDDVTASLKDTDIQQLLREIIFNRRHNRTSILLLVQNYKSIPKDLRRMINNLVLYKINKNEMDNIFSELFENKKECLNDIMRIVFDKPHQFMLMDVDNQKFFKNFGQEIIIEEDSEED